MKVLSLMATAILSLSSNAFADNLDCSKIGTVEAAQATVAKAISGGFQGAKQEVAEKLAQRCWGQAELLGVLSSEFKYGKGDETQSAELFDRIYATITAAQKLRDISESK